MFMVFSALPKRVVSQISKLSVKINDGASSVVSGGDDNSSVGGSSADGSDNGDNKSDGGESQGSADNKEDDQQGFSFDDNGVKVDHFA